MSTTMQAMVLEAAGSPLRLTELPFLSRRRGSFAFECSLAASAAPTCTFSMVS